MFKFGGFWFAFGLLATSAFGRQGPVSPHFVEVKGDHEFTGQMIARPRQVADLMGQGFTFYQALQIKERTATFAVKSATQYRPQLDEYILNVPKGSSEDKFAAELLARGDFQYVEPDWKVFIVSVPNDPLYPQQWHLPKIGAPSAWDLFVGDNSVIVAVTDTGVRLDHEDLQGALVSGYNARTATTQASGADVNDTNGHGTHCAGIAGGIGNNAIGVTGVSQRVKIMPVKVVNGGSGSSSISILTGGAVWAADHGARVITTSFSGFQNSSVQTTGSYIKNTRNGFYCWAAGNDNRDLTTGDWADVTIVGASDSNDLKASFSAFGLAIDVFAPGVGIVSTYASAANGYASLSGTSMATPCTAGVAALIAMSNPALTGQQIQDVLYANCNNIGSSATFGNGRVNINLALRSVYNTRTFSPISVTVTMGSVTGGGPAQLSAMDSQFLTATTLPNASRVSSFQVQYDTSTTISNMGSMTLTYTGMVASSDIIQTIELFDWANNVWVVQDQQMAPQVDTPITLNPASPNNYKNGSGLMRARVTYTRTTGRAPIDVSVDQVAFLTAP